MDNRFQFLNSYPTLYSSINISIHDFIKKIDNLLDNYHLEIVNGPDLSPEKCQTIESSVTEQIEKLHERGELYHTTLGAVHATTTENGQLEPLSANQIREFYRFRAELTKKHKKCTCDGLGAAVFDLADRLLKNMYSGSGIVVDLCQLKNWTHTLLRITQKKAQEEITLFYDPWYQRCYTLSPKVPKVFSESDFSSEMTILIDQTKNQMAPISPQKSIFDFTSNKPIINNDRDFSYYVICSTGVISNPAIKVPEPPVASNSSLCLIS